MMRESREMRLLEGYLGEHENEWLSSSRLFWRLAIEEAPHPAIDVKPSSSSGAGLSPHFLHVCGLGRAVDLLLMADAFLHRSRLV